jgi:hypothetical protein
MNETIAQIQKIDKTMTKLETFKGNGQLVMLVATGKRDGEYVDPVELEFGCYTDIDHLIDLFLSAYRERKEAIFQQVYKDQAEIQNFLQLQGRD